MDTYSQKQKNNQGATGADQLNLDNKNGGQGGENKVVGKKFIIQRIYDGFFAIMVELLKSKQMGESFAILLIIVMFCQIIATLFDRQVFEWEDQYFLSLIQSFSEYIQVFDAVKQARSAQYYSLLFYIAFIYQVIITLLIAYLHYALQYPKIFYHALIGFLQFLLIMQHTILFIPFFDSFVAVFKCEDLGSGSYHFLLTDMECYASTHVGMIILAMIGIVLFISINLMVATLFNETQPAPEDALARLESNFELVMLPYRMTMSILTTFCFQSFCSWIVILISIACSFYFIDQYFKQLPYYNTKVSLVFGAMLGVFGWVSLNGLLMNVYSMSGHIIVIMIGIPLVIIAMRVMRVQKIEWLMYTTLDKFSKDIDCLNQIMTLQDWLRECQKTTNSDINKEIRVKGFISEHIRDCENLDCTCSRIGDLYDNQTDSYLSLARFGLEYEPDEEFQDEEENYYRAPAANNNSQRRPNKVSTVSSSNLFPSNRVAMKEKNTIQADPTKIVEEIHLSEVFLNSFNRQLYKDALQKFVGSVSIHILFAYYYFMVLKNVHAALHELKIASKKRPNLYQKFTIFRYQKMIEVFIQSESEKIKGVYEQLTNVKEFERLYSEMQKQIERVCNHQVEFWTHLASVIPDLNFLNNLNNQIVESAEEAERYWAALSKINNNYPQALIMYAEYLSFIRNNHQAAKQYFDKAEKVNFGTKSAHNHALTSDILFSDEAVIIHISGNKESSGRIVKTSQGLKKAFGWDKTEIMGQNVNLLMTNIFASKHNSYLDQFYSTARKVMFDKERSLFAAHKTGYCFQVQILIKQMPSLKEGIQYVGMVQPLQSENDYIITDLNGIIDSFTSGIGLLFNINPQLVKDNSSLNIQFIAPELVYYFNQRQEQSQAYKQSDSNSYLGNNTANMISSAYGRG